MWFLASFKRFIIAIAATVLCRATQTILKPFNLSTVRTISDFAFSIGYINTTRQWGKCMHVIVSYRYPTERSYLNYNDLRNTALYYAKTVTADLPVESSWEDVNNAFLNNATLSYPLTGISSQFQVMSSVTDEVYEPGNHGTTMTRGDSNIVQQPWINSFVYDCTKYKEQPEAEC